MIVRVYPKQQWKPIRHSAGTLLLSVSIHYHVLLRRSFQKENYTHVASPRVTTDTAAVEFSKIQVGPHLTSSGKSNPTHTCCSNIICTKNLISPSCRLSSYRASVRPFSEGGIDHISTRVEFSTQIAEKNPEELQRRSY